MKKNELNKVLKQLKEPDITSNARVDLLVKLVQHYYDNSEFTEGVKYAAIASVCTRSPRADISCLMGFYYILVENTTMAKMWSQMAYNDVASKDLVTEEWYTWRPLINLCEIAIIEGNLQEASKYIELAKKYTNNEDIINLEKTINEIINNFN